MSVCDQITGTILQEPSYCDYRDHLTETILQRLQRPAYRNHLKRTTLRAITATSLLQPSYRHQPTATELSLLELPFGITNSLLITFCSGSTCCDPDSSGPERQTDSIFAESDACFSVEFTSRSTFLLDLFLCCSICFSVEPTSSPDLNHLLGLPRIALTDPVLHPLQSTPRSTSNGGPPQRASLCLSV